MNKYLIKARCFEQYQRKLLSNVIFSVTGCCDKKSGYDKQNNLDFLLSEH